MIAPGTEAPAEVTSAGDRISQRAGTVLGKLHHVQVANVPITTAGQHRVVVVNTRPQSCSLDRFGLVDSVRQRLAADVLNIDAQFASANRITFDNWPMLLMVLNDDLPTCV